MTTGPSPTGRAILHVDMDAFFVGVELLDHPELRGRPVVVGGVGPRGVVAAASYEARAFGVHSAQPMAVARRRCPHAIVLDGRHDRYREVSAEVMRIFRDVTPLVEPLSLDEAFLDVTGRVRALGPAAEIAAGVRERVASEVGLSCSVGIAPNKFLAKLASQRAKPRATVSGPEPGAGVLEVSADRVLGFLHPLPVDAMWGVGPATHEKLARLGVVTVGDLAEIDEATLVRAVGRAAGAHLAALAAGRDDRPVEPDVAARSISHEETFPTDVSSRPALEVEIVRLSDAVVDRLRATGLVARTVSIKVRFGDFRTITRSVTPGEPVDDGLVVAAMARRMLAGVDVAAGVRLIGVGVSQLVERPAIQLALDLRSTGGTPSDPDRSDLVLPTRVPELTGAIDSIRARFGRTAIRPARLATPGESAGEEPGARPWGPGPQAPRR